MGKKVLVVFLAIVLGFAGTFVSLLLALTPVWIHEDLVGDRNINRTNPLYWFLGNAIAGFILTAGILFVLVGWFVEHPNVAWAVALVLAAVLGVALPSGGILSGAYADDLLFGYLISLAVVNSVVAFKVMTGRTREKLRAFWCADTTGATR